MRTARQLADAGDNLETEWEIVSAIDSAVEARQIAKEGKDEKDGQGRSAAVAGKLREGDVVWYRPEDGAGSYVSGIVVKVAANHSMYTVIAEGAGMVRSSQSERTSAKFRRQVECLPMSNSPSSHRPPLPPFSPRLPSLHH